jgi:hypothetical protein
MRLGARLPSIVLKALNGINNYLYLGWWTRHCDYDPPIVPTRSAIFDLMADRVRGERVLYLEFGVAAGDSLRYWSSLLIGPHHALYGFDSFEGLPMDWIPERPAGFFDAGGEPPDIPDERIEYQVGWFEDSLPEFQLPTGFDRLIVNFDADLYTSTSVIFKHLGERMGPGTIMYFDEFNYREHEFRAFEEFSRGKRFEAIAATPAFAQVAFERL